MYNIPNHEPTRNKKGFLPTAVMSAALAVVPVFGAASWAFADAEPVIVFQHSGIDSMMPNAKDAGLRRAIEMISDRLLEIPIEIQQFNPHDDDAAKAAFIMERVVPIAASMFEYPAEWAIIDNGINDFGVPDIDARILIQTGDPAASQQLHDAVSSIFAEAIPHFQFQPADANENLLAFPTPFATFLFGPADDQGNFVLGFDLGGDGLSTERVALDVPKEMGDITPVYQFHIGGKAIGNIVQQFSGMIPDAEAQKQIRMALEKMEDSPVSIDVAGGFRGGEEIAVAVFRNISTLQQLGANGMTIPNTMGTVGASDFKSIPVDARIASVANQDVGAIIEVALKQAAAQSNGEFDPEMIFSMVEEEIGLNPLTDLINHLGDTWISYTSDSTGGGGFMSFVMQNNGINAEGLKSTFDRLSGMANGIAAENAFGYVRCQSWDNGNWNIPGVYSGYTLTFPGLPVPLELSFALTEDAMIAGLTPQAVQTAVAQSTGGINSSILDNPRFDAAVASRLAKEPAQITFVDMQSCLSRGYPMAQFIGSGLSNFVRSPRDANRDPGMIVPPYHILANDAKPCVQWVYTDGNDYVQITTADSSWWVNIAGIFGALNITPEVIGAGALGAAIGANAN